MKNPNIKTRSAYTFFNSLLKISDILDLSIKNGYSNAFLIDRNIMYGAMEFYFLCIKLNIKPIIGLEVQYNNINKILIAKNFNGYKKLMDISSDIQLKNEINISSKDLIFFEETLSPVLYKNKEDIKILKDFYSIKNIEKFTEDSSHFLSREEFKNINSLKLLSLIDELIDEVDLIIPEKKNILPTFLLNQKKVNPEIFLEKLLKDKLMNLLNKNKFLDRNLYIKRTSYELRIISKMGFATYFLIVMDIVNWAKSNDIFVGPGRGSAPGSIVSFLLNITTIDPIKNNLLFERFLNIERISMPDIDIDFDDTRRDEVIKYIAFKYGENNVAQIITFQTLKAKMSFKDIARINGMSATETNEITKLIPDDMNLEKAYNSSKIFKAKIEASLLAKKNFFICKINRRFTKTIFYTCCRCCFI